MSIYKQIASKLKECRIVFVGLKPDLFTANDHNMMILRQQQFKFQEFDVDKDFQTQKQNKIREDENYVRKINNRKVIKSFNEPKEFVEENGEIKIKGAE